MLDRIASFNRFLLKQNIGNFNNLLSHISNNVISRYHCLMSFCSHHQIHHHPGVGQMPQRIVSMSDARW